MAKTAFQEAIDKAVAERMKFIAANRERLIEAWIAETGLLPSESEMTEQHMIDGTIRVTVGRRRQSLLRTSGDG
jgi:hypothetical protein